MTTPRDPNTPLNPDQLIDAFLDEGPMDLRDQVLDEVRSEVDRTEQRTTFGPWRNLMATRFAGFVAVTAVVAGAVIVGLTLTGGGPLIGGDPSLSPSAQPSGTEAPASTEPSEAPASVEPSSSDDGSLPIGPHVMDPVSPASWSDRVTVTIPALGWFAGPDEGSITKELEDFGPVTVAVVPRDFYRVPRSICNWQIMDADLRETGAPVTADEFVAYLAEQTYDPQGSRTRDFLAPEDITIDGYSGQVILDGAPTYTDSDPNACDEQRFCTLQDRDSWGCLLSHPEPGALDALWIVESEDDSRFWIVASSGWPNTEFRHEELNAIVNSMTFE